MRAYHKIFLIILFFVYLISSFQSVFAQNLDDFPAKRDPATNLSAEREKLEIYSKLRDRRCTTMTLDKCNCPDAREMKAYIEALIEAGVSKEDIFYKVAKKFSLNTILDAQIRADVQNRLIKEVGDKRPQIILEPVSFNFGQVSKKQGKITKIFELSNRGNTDLIIKNIKTSCPCTLVSLNVGKIKTSYFGTQGAPVDWQVSIKPNQTAELETVLDLNHKSVNLGDLLREVSIISNDPLYPEITVRIEAKVKD